MNLPEEHVAQSDDIQQCASPVIAAGNWRRGRIFEGRGMPPPVQLNIPPKDIDLAICAVFGRSRIRLLGKARVQLRFLRLAFEDIGNPRCKHANAACRHKVVGMIEKDA